MTIKESNEPFSNGLKKFLDENGIKRSYVANSLGIPRQVISDIIYNRRLVRAKEMQEIAKILGVSIDEIFKRGKQ